LSEAQPAFGPSRHGKNGALAEVHCRQLWHFNRNSYDLLGGSASIDRRCKRRFCFITQVLSMVSV